MMIVLLDCLTVTLESTDLFLCVKHFLAPPSKLHCIIFNTEKPQFQYLCINALPSF